MQRSRRSKSNKGHAKSAQQIVIAPSIHLGEVIKEKGVKRSKTEKPEMEVDVTVKVKKPKQSSERKPTKKPKMPVKDRQMILKNFRQAINAYQRAIDDLSPALRSPDIIDVPDSLLTPNSSAEIEQTISWLENATNMAKQRIRSALIPQRQMQPGIQTFVPLDQQFRISRLEQALAKSEQERERQARESAASTTERQTEPIDDQQLSEMERSIQNLKLELISSQTLSQQQLDEINRLQREVEEARRLNPNNVEVTQELAEVTQELIELDQFAKQLQQRMSNTQLFVSPTPSPVTERVEPALETITQLRDAVLINIKLATTQAELDNLQAKIRQDVQTNIFAVQNQDPPFSKQGQDQLFAFIYQAEDEMNNALTARKEDLFSADLDLPAGRADTIGGAVSQRAFERRIKDDLRDIALAKNAFLAARTDGDRYDLWITQIRPIRKKLQDAMTSQQFQELNEQTRTELQSEISSSFTFNIPGEINQGSLVLLLPPVVGFIADPNTVGRVVGVNGDTLTVEIAGQAEPISVPRELAYPAIRDTMTQAEVSPPQFASFPTEDPFGNATQSPFSPFRDINMSETLTPSPPVTQPRPGPPVTQPRPGN